MKPRGLHVAFAGGVTGGHIYPGLATAEQLRRLCPAARITFLGAGRPWEQNVVTSCDYDYIPIESQSLGRTPGSWLRFAAAHIRGVRAAQQFIASQAVDAVLGLGGYASLPSCRAAIRLGRPIILLEANAVVGRANRFLAPRAAKVCVAFPQVQQQLKTARQVEITGTPVREAAFPPEAELLSAGPPGPRRLVVLGGSQGAQCLNRDVPEALALVRAWLSDWQVVHIAGAGQVDNTAQRYRQFGIGAEVLPFASDLPKLLCGSHLAISRAGGSTLAELAAWGVPAVLVPYPFAKDHHQAANAQAYQAAGAAVVVTQSTRGESLAPGLVAALGSLVSQNELRESTAQRMRALGRPQAAQAVAMAILHTIPEIESNMLRPAELDRRSPVAANVVRQQGLGYTRIGRDG